MGELIFDVRVIAFHITKHNFISHYAKFHAIRFIGSLEVTKQRNNAQRPSCFQCYVKGSINADLCKVALFHRKNGTSDS